MSRTAIAAAALLAASNAYATTVAFDLPGKAQPQTTQAAYACGDRKIDVTYVNTADNQFAVLDLGEKTIVAVAVMSGSGARYVGQNYEWWSKGKGARLTDLMQDPQKPVECTGS